LRIFEFSCKYCWNSAIPDLTKACFDEELTVPIRMDGYRPGVYPAGPLPLSSISIFSIMIPFDTVSGLPKSGNSEQKEEDKD
jgi:hypothetical protein